LGSDLIELEYEVRVALLSEGEHDEYLMLRKSFITEGYMGGMLE
jgi:hypothetical protein